MRDKNKTLFIILGLAVIISVVFWQVRNFEFVNYDDDKYVSENEHISSGLTIENIIWVFTSEHCGNWHPLTGLSHILDCELFGLNPGRHHLMSLALHIVNSVLILVILRQMTGAFWPSAFVAAVFGLHPLHVESVVWISERKDVLSILFWLLTIAAYLRYAKSPDIGRYVVTLVLFVLGLMAKPMLVTLPFVFLLFDYWPLNRLDIKNKGRIYHLILEKIPFLIFSAVSSVVTFAVQRSAGAVIEVQAFPLTDRIANALMSYVRYIGKMILPVKLAVLYPYPGNAPSLWKVLTASLLLLIITVAVIRLGRKYKYLPVGWFLYLGMLIPVIGIVQVGLQSMAERYTYIPLIGLFIIVAWGTNDLLAKWKYRRAVAGWLSAAVVSVLSILTWFQVGCWRDSETLFGHAIKTTKNNYLAYYNLGTFYYNEGRYDLAIAAYNDAIKINPRYADAYSSRGSTYVKAKGAYDLAILDYNKAVEISPKYAVGYYNRGNAYAKGKGRYDLAISDYSKAIELNPGYAAAYNNRGNAYAIRGEFDLAVSDYSKVIEMNPRDVEAYLNKANACESAGRLKEAVEAYKALIKYAPARYAPKIEFAKQKIRQLER